MLCDWHTLMRTHSNRPTDLPTLSHTHLPIYTCLRIETVCACVYQCAQANAFSFYFRGSVFVAATYTHYVQYAVRVLLASACRCMCVCKIYVSTAQFLRSELSNDGKKSYTILYIITLAAIVENFRSRHSVNFIREKVFFSHNFYISFSTASISDWIFQFCIF